MRTLFLLALVTITGCPIPKDDVTCGDALTCTGGDVCVEHPQQPECENLNDTAETCPEGTTQTKCGGAGIACCCGKTPAPIYECYTPTGCAGTPDCACVAPACDDAGECTPVGSESSGVFRCEPLAKP